MPKKLSPKTPNAKTTKASSLRGQVGTGRPKSGAGSRAGGRNRLMPTAPKAKTTSASSLRSAKGGKPKDGTR